MGVKWSELTNTDVQLTEEERQGWAQLVAVAEQVMARQHQHWIEKTLWSPDLNAILAVDAELTRLRERVVELRAQDTELRHQAQEIDDLSYRVSELLR